ncbi:Sarcolemmal membrane-associated protein [Harpegnathos saltator]|uniref:Sarcolemmal membrane-associated protein n=2 Tax=Harpegnathos saltator TaxID=610380 RepID=E2BTT2_HARSA|nr:Sarcolemmal membrane-associated protein [Harpegnathos saltator]
MVVASGWVKNASSPAAGQNNNTNLNQNKAQNNNNNNNNNNKMTAKGVLICRDNSHPFQERTLTLEQPMKIGRSVARARAAPNNAIFDCKVLSRNHALLWYSSGKFYLRDTCSSNGTFVNNQRLSGSGLESMPKEVCSGDIVQFGVDVVESTKKVTHGCIVATLKLYLPDGKEAKASLSTSVSSPAGNVSLEDLYKLNQVMQEASRREKALYSKLGYLQQLVENTRKAANQSWKALITEDRLLSWVVTVESQLAVYSKNYTEDKIRNELTKLQDEKAQYQNAAKEALQKILQEKLEVTKKLVQLEGRLSETEEECQSLHNVAKYTQTELQELSAKYAETQKKLQETANKLVESEEKVKDMSLGAEQEKRDLVKRLEGQLKIEKELRARLRNSRSDSVNIYKQITALRNCIQTLQDMNLKLEMGENMDSKVEEDPIEAINTIFNKLNSIHVDNIEMDDVNCYATKAEQDNQTSSSEVVVESNQLKSANSGALKELVQEELETMEYIDNLMEYILPPLSSSRKTLVNGNANLDNADSGADSDTNSEATDDTCSITTSDDTSEKTVVENKKKELSSKQTFPSAPCKMEVRFANTESVQHAEIHYEPTEAIPQDDNIVAEVSRETAVEDTLSVDGVVDERDQPACGAATADETAKERDAERASSESECEERLEGEYVKTLKPTTKNDAMQQSRCHSREYILQTLIASLDSLRGEDSLEAQQTVKRELDELKDWLTREPAEVVVDKLRELYYRAKNDSQRMLEINEELVIVKEKYNAIVEEKAELSKKYGALRAQCGDLLSATYTVPIQYVAPLAIMLVWMLLEKIF